MENRKLTRRQALAPIAGMALIAVAVAPAAAQPAQPPTPAPPRGLTAAQKTELNTALRYLKAARRHAVAAKVSAINTERMTSPIDTAIRDVEVILSARG